LRPGCNGEHDVQFIGMTIGTALGVALLLGLYGVSYRLGARVLGISGVGWAHVAQLAALVFGLFLALRIALVEAGINPTALAAIGISYSLQILIGAWFFRDRALTRDAHALGWTGGLRLAALAVTMFSVTILAIGLAYREALRRIAS
jgi:hypothetical protein